MEDSRISSLDKPNVREKSIERDTSSFMDRTTDARRPVIHSPLFRSFLKQYKRNMREYDRAMNKLIYVHNKNKPGSCSSVPRHVFCMDDVDDCLKDLNPFVRNKTEGLFREVDETTVRAMRRPEFKSVLLAFFYVDGWWSAETCLKRSFFNGNGTIAEHVPFISFKDVLVVVNDGKLEAHVHYDAANSRFGCAICFTMPVESDVEKGIYEHSLVRVPKVDLTDRQVMYDTSNETEFTVINFRYIHHEDWLKETNPYKSRNKTTVWKVFVMDKPFQILVRHMSEDVLKVEVDNLQEE